MKQFTKKFMHEHKGCYSEQQLNDCDFMKCDEPITLDMIFVSSIKLKDKYWFVCRQLLTKEQNQQLAIDVAEIVLEIYEKKYPNKKAPREAIRAAKDYLSGIINLHELKSKYDAACDAANAANAAAYAAANAAVNAAAAYAAYDAACAAAYATNSASYAAVNAANGAAYAAYDAARAAVSAANSASDADAIYIAKHPKKNFTDLLLIYLKDFCKKIF